MEGGSGLKKRNRIIITVISIVAVTILISFVKPANLSMRLTSCWNTILLAAIISVMIFCPMVSKERDIFSPFVMASVLLFALFIYAPLTCIISNDLSAVGSMDVFDGCVKATWIYIVSYLFFAWGYATKKRFVFKIKAYRKNNKKDYYDSVDNKETELKDESHVKVKTALIIWSCSLVLSTIYDLSRGISITYLLSYGMLGASGSGTNMNSSLAILGNFSYALIACWLYLLVYSHNIFLKIIVGVMTGSIYFTRGFRFIMMIMILAPIILLYLRKNKRPKMINTILAIILLIIFAGLIEVSRGAIRAGNGGLNMSYSPIELINRVFMSDFTIFKQFYAMVVHIPISYGVVHTESLEKMLLEMGIKNVKHIEYPQFQKIAVPSTEDARKQLRLKEDIPVLLALGATRDDKGLDILLDALNFVNHDFQLLIAGKEESFSEEFIDEHTKKYSTKVTKLLKFLDDYEFAECLSAADFVVLPYRKCFDGASGPLGEGVVLGKTIIGPNHGSLGDIIEKNHLGYIFEAENINSLAKVIFCCIPYNCDSCGSKGIYFK